MENELCDAEMRRIQQYEVDVTLDPDSAHCKLILSEDGKQVRNTGYGWKNLPDNIERFSLTPCVLGKQSFSSGRFYYEVQVHGETEWCVGVVRESINRKEWIFPCPNNGYWTLRWTNENVFEAIAGVPVILPVKAELQKVGVFVDYEERLVSFYDVETRVNFYSFTGCDFTEKLYPFFWPVFTCLAPLIISPVNHTD